MKRVWIMCLCLLMVDSWAAQAPDQPAPFSEGRPGAAFPVGWMPTVIAKVPRTTQFSLVEEGGRTVLRAVSDNAASSLSHKLRVDLAKTPWLNWRWKVSRVIEAANLASKEGDDFAARVYVFFADDPRRFSFLDRATFGLARALYGADLPAASLCYVWDNRYPVDTSTWSAYTHHVRMVVAESGPARVGRWVEISRNVAEDFRNAFGATAPPVSGIAVAADTDNTGESVVTEFGDLVFLPAKAGKP